MGLARLSVSLSLFRDSGKRGREGEKVEERPKGSTGGSEPRWSSTYGGPSIRASDDTLQEETAALDAAGVVMF